MISGSAEQTFKGYTITPIQPTEVIYQREGELNIISGEYKLVTYINITSYDESHREIELNQELLTAYCNQISTKEHYKIIRENCRWISMSTRTIMHEIQQTQNEILSALQSERPEIRQRRGLVNIVGRAAKILFGTCSDEDADYFHSKIAQMSVRSEHLIQLNREQTRIVKASIADINSTMYSIFKAHQDVETSLKILFDNLHSTQITVNDLTIQEALQEQATVIILLLTQQSFEVQKLLNVVNAAIHGQIHPSLMTHLQYLAQLREIRVQLPSGLKLPFSLEQFSMSSLSKIAKISVIYIDSVLVFIQRIPLVETSPFNLYQVIPIPVMQLDNVYSIVKNSITYLAISENKQSYITLTENQCAKCKVVEDNYFCEHVRLRYVTDSQICELQFLIGHVNLKIVCTKQYVKLENSVFIRLKNENVWLFVASNEQASIRCNSGDSTDLILNGTGQVTLDQQCRLVTKDTLLIPSQSLVRNTSRKFFLPLHRPIHNLTTTQIELIQQYNFPKQINLANLEDLVQQSKSLSAIEEEIGVLNRQHPSKRETNYYLVALAILTTVMVTLGISFYCFCQHVAKRPIMYRPDEVIAETSI